MGDFTSFTCYYFAKVNGISFPTSVFTVFFPLASNKENRKPSDCLTLFALFEQRRNNNVLDERLLTANERELNESKPYKYEYKTRLYP